jgi:hypothetical protein
MVMEGLPTEEGSDLQTTTHGAHTNWLTWPWQCSRPPICRYIVCTDKGGLPAHVGGMDGSARGPPLNAGPQGRPNSPMHRGGAKGGRR